LIFPTSLITFHTLSISIAQKELKILWIAQFQQITMSLPPLRVIRNSEGVRVKLKLNWKFQRNGGSNKKFFHGG